jgi:exo-1,4-beta-D-glucosaminidase
LALTWVDWNPAPPDKNMGIWRNVYLRASGPVTLRDPQVITGLDLPLLDTARLAVTAELHNTSKRQLKGILKGRIAGIQFSQSVELAPGEKKLVTFSPDQFPQLKLSHPRLWWPAELGAPNLYTLHIEFNSGGKLSDGDTLQFGIREVSSELNEKGAREFKINGERILIRGGGWAPDMLLRPAPESDEVQIRYVLDLGLNTVRMEGKLESDHFFELADRYGILVMAGWCCCDHWERWDKWKKEDYEIAAESLRSQIRRLRNHPSLLVWLNGSDNPPPPEVEQMYVRILKALHWPNPYLSSATEKPTTVTGPTGVKMTGPYEWVPPSYWLTDTTQGGAWAFNTETSPGPAVPTVQSLRKILPEDRLWPIDEYWNFHAGGGHFKTLDVFTAALNARYGMATGVEDYALKAQAMTYEGNRAMFEAYARNKYISTGVIQWMLNNAWPSLIWHLYDYFLVPGGGYFGTKKACEPLHVQYSYDDRSVVLVNEKRQPFHKLSLTATVYTLDMAVKFFREVTLDVLPDSSTRVFLIPQLEGLTPTFFLNLMLRDAAGSLISSNFYWLSTKPDLLDWAKSKDYADVHGLGYAPAISYADFTALQTLPKVRVSLSASLKREGGEDVVRVKLSNPSPHLAFFVHLRITKDAGGDDVLPVFWDDNYISLLPGETRQLTAKYRTEHVHGPHPVLEAEGWNIIPSQLDLRR